MAEPTSESAREPEWRDQPRVAIGVALAAGVMGAAVCYALAYHVRVGQDVSALLVGPIVGGVVRLVTRGVPHRQALVVAGIALVATLVGFVAADYRLWDQFILQGMVRRILSLVGIVIFSAGTYLAYLIALKRG